MIFTALLLKPCEGLCASYLTPNTPSLNYITQAHGEITLEQGDENYYVVSQNRTDSEITNPNKGNKSNLIFGEDAITEDNILRHYIFNTNSLHKKNAYLKHKQTFKTEIKTRAP